MSSLVTDNSVIRKPENRKLYVTNYTHPVEDDKGTDEDFFLFSAMKALTSDCDSSVSLVR
jgi:hypothetical protein